MRNIVFLLLVLSININAGIADFQPEPFQSKYLKAKELYEKDRFGPAKKLFEMLVKQNNSYEIEVLCQYYIALCSYQLKDKNTEYNIDHFLIAHSDHKLSEKIRFVKGKYKFSQKKFQESIFLFSQVDEQQLNNDELLELRFKTAYAHFYRKDFQNALKNFIEIRDIPSPYYYPSNYYIAYMSYYEKDYDEALNSFYKVNVSKLYKKVVPYYIAQIYFIKGKYEQVIEYATPLLKNPNFKYALETTYLVGKSFFNTDAYYEALPYLKDYIKNAPKLIPSDIYNLGFSYYKVKNQKKAIEYLKQITDNKDSLAQNANYIMANAFLELGEKRNAKAAFFKTKQIELDKELTELASFNHAKMCYDLELFESSINDMQSFLDKYPDSKFGAEAKEMLSQMFLKTNSYQKAINIIETIESPSPKIDAAYQRVCYLRALELFKSNDASESIKYFKKSISNPLDKNLNAATYYWLGEVAYHNGRYTDAQTYMNRFLELYELTTGLNYNESPAFAYYTLGYTYYKSGAYNDALLYFEKSDKEFKKTSQSNKRSKVYLKTFPDVLLRSADCNFLIKNYKRSADYYTQVIEANFSGRDYALFQKAILYGLGLNADPTKKIAQLELLLKDYSWSLYADDANFEIADTYFNIGDFDKAIESFNKTISSYQGSQYHRKSLLKLALINFNKDNFPEAEANCIYLLNQFPNSEEIKEVVHILKDIYIENGDPDGFLELSSKYQNINLSLEAQDSIMYYAAESQYIKQSCDAAIELFGKYLDHYPLGYFAINAHYYRSQCLINDKLYHKAKTDLEYVIKKGHSKYNETALSQLASIYHHQESDWSSALKAYSQLYISAESKNNKFDATKGLVHCYYNLNDYNNCLSFSKQLLKNENLKIDNEPWLDYYMAKSYLGLNQLDTAYLLFDSLGQTNDNSYGIEAKYWKALIHFEKGEYDTSKTLCFDFISNVPSSEYWRVKCFILLADLFAIENNNYQAKATLESILENYEGKELRFLAQTKLDSIISEDQKEALPIIPKDSLDQEEFIIEDSSIYIEYDTVIMNNGDTILIETEMESDED